MEMTIKNIGFMYTPLTKQLIINYIKIQYEENTDISEESLKKELLWLYDNNQLHLLIEGEYLSSEVILNS